MYDELTLGEGAVDVSPLQALDKAEYFLVGQGYVTGRRTATTLTVEQEGTEGAAAQEGTPKMVIMTVPQFEGGVRIKVRGESEVQGCEGLSDPSPDLA